MYIHGATGRRPYLPRTKIHNTRRHCIKYIQHVERPPGKGTNKNQYNHGETQIVEKEGGQTIARTNRWQRVGKIYRQSLSL